MSNKKTKGVMLLLVIAVILMTVGFAAYAQRLNINGNVTVKGKPWNVHFESGTVTPTTGGKAVTAKSATVSETDFAFTVTLEKPGDFYEATVNVINEGSMNAYLKKITMSDISTHSKYLLYTVTYNNGTTYSATSNVSGVTLAADATHPVKVRVEYLEPASSTDLPSGDVTVTVTGNLDYSSEQ